MSGNALDIHLRGRLPRLITLAVEYRVAAHKSDSRGTNRFPANPQVRELDWGRAGSGIPHNLATIADWATLAVIDVGCILRANSGSPYILTTANDDSGDGMARDRPRY